MFLAATLAAPPAQPQMWVAHNATITTTGTMTGLDQGTVELTLSYDYEQKMEKHVFKSGQDAGKTVVFRWDKKDPGEPWSRAFEWTPGKEALCCYIDLCTASPCSISTAARQLKLEVDKHATDVGPEPTGEHWFKDMSIHVLNVTNLNDWVVDPNTSAISNWTSYVTMPAHAGWARKETIYGGLTLGGLSEADFSYPKFCDVHRCGLEAEQRLRYAL